MSNPGREPTVSDEEILSVFGEVDAPVLSTREIAEAIGLGRRGTYDRLQSLATDGALRAKKLDEKRTVWWHPDTLYKRYSSDT